MANDFYESETVGPGLLLRLSNKVDTTNFGAVIDMACEEVGQRGARHVGVNLSHVDYLYSTALGQLVKLHKRVREVDGTLYLCDLDDSCRKVLNITQFDRVLVLYDTEDQLREAWADLGDDVPPPAEPAPAPTPQQVDAGGTALAVERLVVDHRTAEREEREWGVFEWLARPENVDTDRFRVARTRVLAGRTQAYHVHPSIEEVVYVLSGSATLWIESESAALTAGRLAVVPVGKPHAIVNDSEEDFVVVNVFGPATFEGEFEVDVSEEEPWRSAALQRRAPDLDCEWDDDLLFVRVTCERLVEPGHIDRFRSSLVHVAEREQPKRVVIDLASVKHIATGGLGALNRLREKLGEGSTLGVTGLRDDVRKIFEITKLDRIIPVYADRDAAKKG